MAQLQWNQVDAPNLSGGITGIEAANRMIGGGLGDMATALSQFGDRQALEQLSRYSDAQKLQQDLQAGTFNTGKASAEALKTIMGRPSDLIRNAYTQQAIDHSAVMNPLDQQYRQLEIDDKLVMDPLNQEAKRLTNTHDAVMNPLIQSDKRLSNYQNYLGHNRSEDERALGLAMGQQWAAYTRDNLLTPDAAAAFVDQYSADPVAHAMARAMVAGEMPGYGKAIIAPSLGSIPGAGGTVPVAGQSATTGGSVPLLASGGGIPVPASATKAQSPLNLPTEVSSSLAQQEQSLGIPSGVLTSIVQQEVGGRLDEFLKDPAKYHYEPDASGNRKSTAFGPFGILESTAKDPGYGVKPLQNKSLPEQIRFASEYAAARAKDAGSWEKGLAGYGEGAKYAQAVIGRLNGQQATTLSNMVTQDNTTSRQLLQAANMFSDTGLMNAAAAAYKKDPEGLESDQAVALRMTEEGGSLKGISVNDARSAIKDVQTELGVSAAVAGTIVERAFSGGFLSSFGRNSQKIDRDALGNLLDTIGGKRSKDGKYENRNKVNTVLNALIKNTASENANNKLASSEKEIAEIAAYIKQLEGMGTSPAVQQGIAAANARLAVALANQQQAMESTNSAVLGRVGDLTPPAPPPLTVPPVAPAPVATKPAAPVGTVSSGSKNSNAVRGLDYSASAEYWKNQAQQNAKAREEKSNAEAARKAKEAKEEMDRRRAAAQRMKEMFPETSFLAY